MTADRRPPTASTAPASRAIALALCAAALAWAAAPANAQEQASPLRPALEPAPAPLAQKPAYRGRARAVGKPVRPAKTTVQKPARGIAAIRSPGESPLVPPVGSPSPAAKPGPALPETTASLRRKPATVLDPYAPTGIEVGAFLLRPSFDISGGYTSNPDQIPNPPTGSWMMREEGQVLVESQWQRHALTMALRGGYSEFFESPASNRPDGDATARLRLDVLRDTVVDLAAVGRLSTQQPGIEQPVIGARRALVWDYGTSAGVTQTVGRMSFGLTGGIARTIYGNIPDVGGGTTDQSNRNLTAFEGRLRAGYEVSPAVRPFVETALDHRVYDTPIDSGGYARSSVGTSVRAGATLGFSALLTGEISVGYGWRDYEDPRLAPIGAPVLDAALIWSPTALTTVTLRAGSEIAETSVANASGAVVQRASVEVAHALRRNLTVTGALATTHTIYQGVAITEDKVAAGVKLDWKLSRTVVVRASYAHERLQSSTPGADYTANVYLVGLRFQR